MGFPTVPGLPLAMKVIGAHLRQSEPFPQPDALLGLIRFDESFRQRGSSGDQEADGGKVGLGKSGGFEEHLEHGGDPEEEGQTLALDEVQDQIGVEALDQDIRSPEVKQGKGEDVPARGVEEGGVQNRAVFRAKSPAQVGIDRVPGDHAVGQDDPFGDPGGP